MKKTIKDLELKNKTVLLRVDFNVPLNSQHKILDATRILEELPTINYILDNGAKLVICSHLGRPDGKVNEEYSLKPVYEYLKNIYPNTVKFASSAIGKDTTKLAKNLRPGEILLLENLRFHAEEEANDENFAKKLASLADIYVNDAFGTSHRKHASTYTVAKFLPSAIGFLIQKEIEIISGSLEKPEHPFVAIIGGAKVKDKINTIKNLIEKADTVLIGGGMANTFLKASGIKTGAGKVDEDNINFAKEMFKLAKKKNKKLIIPIDYLCSADLKSKAKKIEGDITDNLIQYDIGPKTIKLFTDEIKMAKLIIWNGPVGFSEYKKFSKGTRKVAQAIAKTDAISIVGGGDSVSAINKLKLGKKFTHLSTGGGASLKLLEGSPLPGIEVINEKERT